MAAGTTSDEVAVDRAEVPAPNREAPPAVRELRSRIAPWLLPAAFLLPVLGYAWELRDVTHYQFAWLYVPAVLALVPARIRELGELRPGTARGTWRWWAPAIALAMFGTVTAMPWLGTIGAMFYAAGAAYASGGRTLVRAVAPAWCCLWLAIRPPLDLDVHLIYALQGVAASVAGRLLDGFGQVNLLSGHIITVPGKRLLIEEACSGVQSLFAGWACAWLWCLALRRSRLRTLLLTISVPLWAVLANALRIVVIAVLWNEHRLSVDQGWAHEALGLGVFVLVLGMILSTDSMLGWFLRAKSKAPPVRLPKTMRRSRQPVVAKPRAAMSPVWRARGAIVGGCALVGLQVALVLAGDRLLSDGKSRAAPPDFAASALPQQIGSWRQVGFENVARNNTHGEGTGSKQWHYEGPHGKAIVSIDWPFAGWHELSVCYPAEGWEPLERSVAPIPCVCVPGTTVLTAADYRRGTDGLEGRLWFELFDLRGNPIYESGDPLSLQARLLRRLTRWQDRVWGATPTLQFQVFLESVQTARPDEHDALARAAAGRELFDAARAALVPACVERPLQARLP